MTNLEKGKLVLRFGLVAVYLYFGIVQLLDIEGWIGMVPSWASNLPILTPYAIVLFNGIFEIVFGILLALGIRVAIVSSLLATHLAIITFGMGFNPIGVRDFGLTLATIALTLFNLKENQKYPTL